MRIIVAVLVSLAFGCQREGSEAPRAQTSGGAAITTKQASRGGASTDASTRVGEASSDGGVYVLSTECHDVPLVRMSGDDAQTGHYVNAADDPTDFKVTRTVGTFAPNCAIPTIRIVLSDGSCPAGLEHELTFELDAAALNNRDIHVGLNIIEQETPTSAIHIRYTRPRTLLQSGEFGTCGAGVQGEIVFRDNHLGTGPDAQFEASFQLTLPPCDDGEATAQRVIGTFNVPMMRSLKQACSS